VIFEIFYKARICMGHSADRGDAVGLCIQNLRVAVEGPIVNPAQRYFVSWRAIKALTIPRARSVCGPGVATHSCSQPSNT
jgi:hypothetical protein